MIGILLFLSGCTSNNNDNNISDDDSNWLENYTPVHTVGTDSDDFWIEFPADNDYYGQPIEHFDWVIDKIENNCVLFVVHRTGCKQQHHFTGVRFMVQISQDIAFIIVECFRCQDLVHVERFQVIGKFIDCGCARIGSPIEFWDDH